MNALRGYLALLAIFAFVQLFAGCSDESPRLLDASGNPIPCQDDEDEPGDVDENDEEDDDGPGDDDEGECDDD